MTNVLNDSATDLEQQHTREERRMRVLLPIGLILAATAALFARFHAAGHGFLAFYEDDFFYYLRIAQRIVAGNHSTYTGSYLTSGYHPLWMLVITVLTGLFGTGIAFFYALQSLLVVCVLPQ